jgi:glycosyltransferase involved in cell wall biosynthesis
VHSQPAVMSNASSISDGSRPLLEHLDRFAASHGNEPLTVHFDSSDASCLADILARPFVRSVVLTRRDEAAAAAYPGRVGWLNFADNDYAEPTMAGTTLWRWKQHFPLSGPAILTYQEHGVRRFALATDMLATMPLLGPDEELKRSRRRERPTTPSYLRKLAPLRTYAQSLVEELNWSRRFSGLASGAPDRPEEAGASGILLVTQTLLAGGSERQVVNTALGLSRRTSEPVGILCAAGAAKADRFHQWRLADSNVLVTDLPARPSTPLPPALDARLAELWVEIGPSDGLIDTIIRLTAELIARKPRVVHAWLDAINIAAGFAAKLAGVPRIVLSTRSLSPLHYPFLQPYMRPGYRHLRRIEGVQIVSNSEAGARDYARWLKVLPRSISVIRNGIDAAEIDAVTTEQIDAYRTKIGLARHTPVVGGVFRLYEEKRPLLWAEVAAVLAKARPDVAFLIVGDGRLLSTSPYARSRADCSRRDRRHDVPAADVACRRPSQRSPRGAGRRSSSRDQRCRRCGRSHGAPTLRLGRERPRSKAVWRPHSCGPWRRRLARQRTPLRSTIDRRSVWARPHDRRNG